jgi:5-methylcytosine-specific restriction protein A
MLSAPTRYCLTPRCGNKVTAGHCPEHARRQGQERTLRQGTRHERGYDNQWVKLRDWFIKQPENALCRMCEQEGRAIESAEVDHIVPFRGLDDPLRLDPTNLQGLCKTHHHQKHRPNWYR